jgi:hypothetical protein
MIMNWGGWGVRGWGARGWGRRIAGRRTARGRRGSVRGGGDCGRVAGAGDLVVLYLCRERDTLKKFNYVQ